MNTRVPFDDDYVKLVGTAVYLFSYYEWAIIYVVERLEHARLFSRILSQALAWNDFGHRVQALHARR